MTLKIEEKLKRKSDSQNKNRGGKSSRGKGRFGGRGSFKRNEESSSKESHEGESSNRGSFRGRRGNGRGRASGRTPGLFIDRCFYHSQVGHQASKYPNKTKIQQGGDERVHLTHEEEVQSNHGGKGIADPEDGESLMFNRTLIKKPQVKEPPKRRTLFKTSCSIKGKKCKVIVDLGSNDNLASSLMVEKLRLKKFPHPTPYKVSWLNKEQKALVNE